MAKYLDSVGLSKAFDLIKGSIASKQDTLVSGTNIKTINNTSLLGSGNISISGDSGGGLSVDDVYPVGSIYMSVNSTNPSTLFGGTWQQLEDTFLLGAGSSYSVNHVNDSTPTIDGGESTHILTPDETATKNHSHTYAKPDADTDSHKLTVSEIPAHKHDINERNSSGTSTGWSYTTENGKYAPSGNRIWNNGGGNGHSHGISTTDTTTTDNPSNANGIAHNNMPPYMVVYIWKRTA